MFRNSLRKALLLSTCIALCITICIALANGRLRHKPIHLHLYGTKTSPDWHSRIDTSPLSNLAGERWDLVATIDVVPGVPFGLQVPNNREPFIDVRGAVTCNYNGSYHTRISYTLDDSHLTYVQTDEVDLGLNQVEHIDKSVFSDYCYLLSELPDADLALAKALKVDLSDK